MTIYLYNLFFFHVAALDKSSLDSGPAVCELFAAIVLDALSPNTSSAFGVKASDTSLAIFGKVDPDSTVFVQQIHRQRRCV